MGPSAREERDSSEPDITGFPSREKGNDMQQRQTTTLAFLDTLPYCPCGSRSSLRGRTKLFLLLSCPHDCGGECNEPTLGGVAYSQVSSRLKCWAI